MQLVSSCSYVYKSMFTLDICCALYVYNYNLIKTEIVFAEVW